MARHQVKRRQRGAALFIALIALVFMLLGGLALVRSVDTANLIAGNFAFKQATLHASDAGVEAALALIDGTIVPGPGSRDAVYPAGCATAPPTSCRYFPTRQDVDAAGIPTAVGGWSALPAATVDGNSYQFVIDRLCQGPLPVTDIQSNCISGKPAGAGSKKIGAAQLSATSEVYYRATIRVTGPRNTGTVVQVLLAH